MNHNIINHYVNLGATFSVTYQKSGTEHAPTFICRARFSDGDFTISVVGRGPSKSASKDRACDQIVSSLNAAGKPTTQLIAMVEDSSSRDHAAPVGRFAEGKIPGDDSTGPGVPGYADGPVWSQGAVSRDQPPVGGIHQDFVVIASGVEQVCDKYCPSNSCVSQRLRADVFECLKGVGPHSTREEMVSYFARLNKFIEFGFERCACRMCSNRRARND